jgi:1,2-diacylglycerol 3-beta-galactosyltransferase
MTGLPIRHDFAVEAHKLGDRTTPEGKEYQKQVRESVLALSTEKPVILLMGGGEGVGSLETIVDEMYASFVQNGIDATICVVCGRNEKLKKEIEEKNWDDVVSSLTIEGRKKRMRRRRDRRSHHDKLDPVSVAETPGNVDVVGLGFITNMAEWMVAADVLVTKAGPGSIAEAASVGLPVLMTSYLPGQEAGNVDFVEEKGFGDYCDDPVLIADEVSGWLKDPQKIVDLSKNAQAAGHPDAAAEIVADIGSITHTWMALNGGKQ